MTSRRASDTMNSWPSAARSPAHVADLRLLDRKRRRLPHLPAHQLIEILRARRHLLEPDQRHLGHRIRHDQRRCGAAGPTALEHAAERARRPPRDRGCSARSATARARRRGSGSMACAATTAWPPRHSSARGRHAVGGDLDGDRRAAARRGARTGCSFDERHLVDLAQRRDALHARARPPTRAGTACPPRAPPS